MSKVKEIRKIESKIKEMKKDKVESLDDEFEEDSEKFLDGNVVFTNRTRRFNKTSTLDTNEVPQDSGIRERRVVKEDENEINFRPSYATGINPSQNKSYTPVGSAESSSSMERKSLSYRGFEDRSSLQRIQQDQMQPQNQSSGGRGGEIAGERVYAGEGEQGRKRDKRNDF